MPAAPYHVEVRNLTRGWTLTATSGDDPDTDDPDLAAVLTAPLRIRWDFERGLVPGHLEPVRLTFGMWSRSLAVEPDVDLGDVIAVDVRLGVAGPYLYRFEGGRVTDAPTDLAPGQPWAVRTTVEVADFLADAASRFPTYGNPWGVSPGASLQTRLAMVGSAMGYSIGIQSYLATEAVVFARLRARMWGDSAMTILRRIINSAVVNGAVHHTLVSRYTPGQTAYPTGYKWADPTDRTDTGSGQTPGTPLIPDPLSQVRYLVVPASRREAEPFASPLQFGIRDGLVTLLNTPGGTSPRRHPALKAAWITAPSSLRRKRDHLVNTVRIKGTHQSTNAVGSDNYDKAGSLEVTNPAEVAARGSIARDLDTDLVLRTYVSDDSTLSGLLAGVADVANSYLVDPTVLASNRAYEGIALDPDLMSAADQSAILPYLPPQPPGLGDGRVLRHLTVWGVSGNVLDPDVVPGGFVSGGELVIERGHLRYTFTTTPGQPTYTSTAPTPITVGQFIGKTFATTSTIATLDPTIRVGDLDQIGA